MRILVVEDEARLAQTLAVSLALNSSQESEAKQKA